MWVKECSSVLCQVPQDRKREREREREKETIGQSDVLKFFFASCSISTTFHLSGLKTQRKALSTYKTHRILCFLQGVLLVVWTWSAPSTLWSFSPIKASCWTVWLSYAAVWNVQRSLAGWGLSLSLGRSVREHLLTAGKALWENRTGVQRNIWTSRRPPWWQAVYGLFHATAFFRK